ncbi:hypothetical protein Vadar_023183 [Vaccinium darrowii]|uniref:Uncharacterized protein n=1 Tax=Vaccinium darrowii TaxID=229202 RepID=A0ACB7XJQ8_9ERIC|nr:hypothetical protein Vadar_023183 [Vaccinium darrowii]
MSNFLARREKRTVQCVSGKAGIKILCALLSLPIPPEVAKPLGEEVANTVNGVLTNFLLHKTLNKLLLVGCKFPRDLIHSSIQCAYFSQRLGLALGAAVMDKKSARILGLVIMLSFLLARGYYIQHVLAFNAWIKYYLQHVPALLIKKKHVPAFIAWDSMDKRFHWLLWL